MSISQLGSFSNEYITSELCMSAAQSAFRFKGVGSVCHGSRHGSMVAVLCWLAVHPLPPLLSTCRLAGRGADHPRLPQ